MSLIVILGVRRFPMRPLTLRRPTSRQAGDILPTEKSEQLRPKESSERDRCDRPRLRWSPAEAEAPVSVDVPLRAERREAVADGLLAGRRDYEAAVNGMTVHANPVLGDLTIRERGGGVSEEVVASQLFSVDVNRAGISCRAESPKGVGYRVHGPRDAWARGMTTAGAPGADT